MDLTKIFNAVKQREVTRKAQSESSFKEDTRQIKFECDKTYRFRLIAAPTSARQEFFINQQKHSFYDKETKEYSEVICPTSEYLKGVTKEGFDACRICSSASKFYNDFTKLKSPSSEELYKKFKRKFNGYALVYVVSDPTTPENVGTIKIMRYGKEIDDTFKKYIFGIVPTRKRYTKDGEDGEAVPEFNEDEVIGVSAFELKNGYDVIIEVTKKGEYNKYNVAFSRKATTINITEKFITDSIKELKFDEDFYKSSTKEEINKFYNDFVLASEVTNPVENKEEEIDEEDSIPMDTPPSKKDSSKAIPVSKKETKKVEEPENIDEEDSLNIDDILADLDK